MENLISCFSICATATYTLIEIPHSIIVEKFAEVNVVVVFDAMMSGLPTNKEDFAGYCFLTLNQRIYQSSVA